MSSEPSIEQFLLELKSQDVRVWLDGEVLRVSAPRDGLAPVLRERLAARKAEVLAFLRMAARGDDAITPRGPQADAAGLPLSFDQQRIWFLQRLSPGGLAFHLQTSLVVEAEPRHVEQAWAALLQRHEILRTVYAEGPKGPLQVVAAPAPFALPCIDLGGHDAAALTHAMQARASKELHRPFDLVHGPVWRVLLFGLAPARTVVFVFLHHIATDGWSLARLNAELRELCEAAAEGREARLPALPIQYADFALWQRRSMQGEVLAEQLAHWRERLAGMPQALELPLDFPRPAQQSGNGRALTLSLPADLSRALRRLGQQHQATPYMVLLALFELLLARQSGGWDVVVGTPVAGRARPELEHVQGLFLNSLVMRTRLAPDLRFVEVLQRVRATALAAFSHQGLPFQKLVDELRPPRDLSRNPLFQAMFNMLVDGAAGGLAALPANAVEAAPAEAVAGSVQVDLALDVLDAGDTFTLAFNYATDLFRRTTVARLGEQYLRLAQSAVAAPERAAGALDLLGPDWRERLLHGWNDTRQDVAEPLVSRAFERQAARAGQATALVFGDRALDYAELNARANRLARHLRSLAPPEAANDGAAQPVVGVYLQRGVEMVVGVLASLKAGLAYVPLDPAYPRDRLEFMLQDSAAALLLTQESLRGELDAGAARVVSVDGDAAQIAARSGADLDTAPAPSDLAYMIYTSGSTGRPKGVQIEHRSLASFVQSMAQQPGMAADDVLVAVTTLSFDIAGLELYVPLTVGARLVLAPRETAIDGQALARLLARSRATVMQATPATWRLLLAAGWTGDRRLTVLCGGEALPRDLAERLLAVCGPVWNLYGPTETTIWSTACRVASGAGPVPIGRPIANTRVYVLDGSGAPVPVGVTGELHIGGIGVARGYFRREALTAERFIPDTFSGEPGARLYRTGDSARYLADGQLEYQGRMDTQVKLRGFRIELGEIEAVLARVPGVAVAAVLVREDRPGDPRLTAYVARAPGHAPTEESLRAAAARQLPAYMVPAAWMLLDALPLTPNGKIDRQALPALRSAAADAPQGVVEPRTGIERRLAAIWGEVLQVEHVGVHDNFFDVGGHSLLVVQVQNALQRVLGLEVPVVELFEYPTIATLAARLGAASGGEAGDTPDDAPDAAGPGRGRRAGLARRAQRLNPGRGGPADAVEQIAVIGLDGRFPGADTVADFWTLLREGREAITFFDDAQLLADGTDPAMLQHPDFVKAKGVARDVDLFDAAFFKYSPADAEALDPQQRLFLQCAWRGLEDAGYDSERHRGAIGVYAATSLNSYSLQSVLARGDASDVFLNDKDFLATRVAYKLDLHGPCMTVQTACSSSLVALAEACESLLAHRCDMALAGGVSIGVPVTSGYLYQEGGIRSRDGHCRPFDARSDGCVGGDGVAVVVLKRLSDALADGDTIHAVVKGAALNNDGANKVGFTAPSVAGQAEVIAAALAVSGVSADSIGYVETHGTGTVLGDPIEIAALTRAFGSGGTRPRSCAIGTLKPNIGHLDAAAGIAGFVKAVLCLKHRQLPASLHFETPNPKIDFDNSPFYVNASLADWPAPEGHPRRAGVSSFGIGGTNAHVILEEAPSLDVPDDAPAGAPQLILLSAKTGSALDAATQRLGAFLGEHPGVPLADVAFTLQAGRRVLGQRRFAVCADAADAARVFGSGDATRLVSGTGDAARGCVVFLFSGQGAQYAGMTRGLYDAQPAFRAEVDRCAALLEPHLGFDLRTLLYPEPGAAGETAASRINQTANAQPALFVVEYALARLWMSWGVVPEAMVGHSIGEYVAACIAGVMSLADALAIVALRGRLMQAQPAGAMLSVPLGAEAVAPFLRGSVCVAAANTASLCVASGPGDDIEVLAQALAAAGHDGRRLQTSHAFHSGSMAAVEAPLAQALQGVRLHAPRIPYVSNVSGRWITADEATDPAYWGRHVVAPVQFASALDLLAERRPVYLEVGPGNTLCTFARLHATGGAAPLALPSVRHPREGRGDAEFILATLGRFWLAGMPLDAARLHAGRSPRRVPLPGYPFEGRRFWLPTTGAARPAATSNVLEKRADLAQWCYVPGWKSGLTLDAESAGWSDGPETDAHADADSDANPLAATWLVFLRPEGVAEALARQLEACGGRVVRVTESDRFRVLDPSSYAIDPTDPGGYRKLFDALHATALEPARVVHAWGLSPGARDGLDAALDLGFYSVLYLVQALAARVGAAMPRIELLTECTLAVSGEEAVRAAWSPVLGLARVVPQEMPGMACNVIDLGPAEATATEAGRVAQAVLGELAGAGRDPLVALRQRRRWLPVFEPAAPGAQALRPTRLRERGVYLVTGGLGGVGLALAEHLARTVKARLVLVGRSPFPDRAGWDDWAARHDEHDATARRIRRLRAMEALGAEVLVMAADVADPEQMQAVATAVARRFGAPNGVIHAAGILSGDSLAPIQKLTRAECEQQFRPKIRGLQTLQALFDGPSVDFMLAISSVSTVLGGLGLAAYAAANQFMDALAHRQRAADQRQWTSIDWDAWQFQPVQGAAPRKGSLAALALTPEEGVQVFERILRLGRLPQVVVSTADLDRRIERGRVQEPSPAAAPGEDSPRTGHARPALASGYVAPRSEAERAIAEVWQELLGIDSIGIYDNFFDLGGHSLLAVRAAARLREKFGVSLSLERFLELGTIDQVAWQTLGQLAASLEGEAAPAPEAPPAAPDMPLLEPFFFGGDERTLFGIVRRAPQPRGAGIVLCAPHAHEYIRCHRTLRELGQRLAMGGFDVLSFDYYGTGDSGGDYEEGTVAGWRGDTGAAVDVLCRRPGIRKVCLLGLRMGGTLAMQVARSRADVHAIALWDPIVAGGDMCDETDEIAALQAMSLAEQQDVPSSDVLAYPLTAALARDVAAIDLCAELPPQLPAMLVLETGQEGSGRRLADLARSQGAKADYRRVDEARVWTREPYEAVSPREAMAALVTWIEEALR